MLAKHMEVRMTSCEVHVARSTGTVLVGDACLFTAAAFCVLVWAPPLALLAGRQRLGFSTTDASIGSP